MNPNTLSSFSLPLLLLTTTLLLLSFPTTTSTTHLPSSSLATSSSKNIVEILQKASGYGSFLRLLKATQMDSRINSEIRKSNQGLTIFAPTDDAFSALKSGTLNTLSNEQQVQLVQFHVLTSYLSPSQFATATNPLNTQAGSSADGQFSLNVTTDAGASHVNLTTGVVNATVADTVFSDGHLAVYHVDKVLQPQIIFAPLPPAPAPAPAKHKKAKKSLAPAPVKSLAPSKDDSAAVSTNQPAKIDTSGAAVPGAWRSMVLFGGATLAAVIYL